MASKPTQVTTNEVRISYEHLLKPYANKPGAEEKFSATLLIPKADIATKQRIDAAIQAAAQEGLASRWGGVRPPHLPTPVWDGDGVRQNGEAFGPECKGHWVMTASSKQRPEIVDLNLSPVIDATEIYSGMYAKINVNFFAYFSNGKKGIGCGLGPVQKTRDGEPLGGHVSAAEAFGGGAPAAQYNVPYQPPVAPPPQYAPPSYDGPYARPDPNSGEVYWPRPAQQPQQYTAIDPITGQPIQR